MLRRRSRSELDHTEEDTQLITSSGAYGEQPMTSVNNNIQRKASLSEELEAQNLLRLKTFSKSLEDLTSETLYSKWKRARASPAKHPGRRGRSVSLITVPEMIKEEKETGERSRKNSFYDLQEVFRPRFWSTGGIYEENENETVGELGNLLPGTQQVLPLNCENSSQERHFVNSSDKENYLEIESEDVLIAKPVSENGLCPPRTRRQANSPLASRKVLTIPRELPKRGGSPIIVQALGDEEPKETREILREKKLDKNKSEVSLSVPPKRRMSSPASSPNVFAQSEILPEKMADFNVVGPVCSESSTDGNNVYPPRPDKEGERASLRMYYTSLGCTTYAIVSQPFQTAKSANVLVDTGHTGRTVSESDLMDTLKTTSEGEQILKRLSRASSFNESPRQPQGSGEMVRRLSVQSNRVTRPTAQDLLSNIANASHKTERDRFRDIERAFDWVRKELADLRAQDKDIMRMFNKIQAGIRQMQMNRSTSESSESSFEEECGSRYHTIGKSMSTTYMPLLKEIGTFDTFPRRRASLI